MQSGSNHAPFWHLEVPNTGWTFHVMAASDRPNASCRITLARFWISQVYCVMMGTCTSLRNWDQCWGWTYLRVWHTGTVSFMCRWICALYPDSLMKYDYPLLRLGSALSLETFLHLIRKFALKETKSMWRYLEIFVRDSVEIWLEIPISNDQPASWRLIFPSWHHVLAWLWIDTMPLGLCPLPVCLSIFKCRHSCAICKKAR